MHISILKVFMNPVAKKPVSLLKAFPHISGTMEFFCEPQNTDETASRTEAVFSEEKIDFEKCW